MILFNDRRDWYVSYVTTFVVTIIFVVANK